MIGELRRICCVYIILYITRGVNQVLYNEHQCLNKATGYRLGFLIGK
jgi:hypothetical protein